MENFKFLTTINGIYNTSTEAKDLNIISHLDVYFNETSEIIKIKYHEIYFSSSLHLLDTNEDYLNVNKGEYLLDLGEMKNSYIIENINEKCIKELIFADFNDHEDRYLIFEKIF